MSDALIALALANLAAAAAVLVVLALRRPARRLFGPRIAYGLWLLVPAAALATLLPARIVTVTVRAATPTAIQAPIAEPDAIAPVATASAALDLWAMLAGVWIVGALASLAWIAWRQRQFDRAMADGLAGPAAVGVLTPRIVTPDDFGLRYTPREQFVVLAHEQTHIARHDTRINALVVAARCLNWFNPLVHVLARCLRTDQELACDADVIGRHPKVRRSYAEAMLKTQLAARPLPLGCYWPAPRAHPLTERIRLLSRQAPDPREQALGLSLLTVLALATVGSAWAAKPAQVQFVELPAVPARLAPLLTRIAVVEPPTLAPMSNQADRPVTRRPVLPPAPMAPGAVEAQAHADAQAAPALRERDRARGADERSAGPQPRPEPQPDPRSERQPRRIYTAAGRSSVEPGSAIRVVASSTDAVGRPLMTDLTSFGSQHFFRTGTFVADGSKERLFTAVTQRGQRLWVTASLSKRFNPDESTTVEMAPGETRSFTLPNGRPVIVTPTLRAETAEEMAGGRGVFDAVNAELKSTGDDAWRAYRDRCRTEGC